MNVRMFLLLLPIALTYGRANGPLRIGDWTSEIRRCRARLHLRESVERSGTGASIALREGDGGCLLHNTSDNLESVHRWNNLVDQYARKSVGFVWVTGEPQSSLRPWLRQHPVKGLVLFDPQEATA